MGNVFPRIRYTLVKDHCHFFPSTGKPSILQTGFRLATGKSEKAQNFFVSRVARDRSCVPQRRRHRSTSSLPTSPPLDAEENGDDRGRTGNL